ALHALWTRRAGENSPGNVIRTQVGGEGPPGTRSYRLRAQTVMDMAPNPPVGASPAMPDFEKLAAACTIARGLAMDAVHACSSGHLGLPLGATEVGAVLYGELLRHDPADPQWINRDRFVLSAGHGSMFLYGWL